MTDTIPHRPRAAAGHTGGLPRPLTGCHRVRPPAELQLAVRHATCGHCWASPGRPCEGTEGHHLARFARARRRGLLTEAEFASVLADLGVFTDATVIRGGAR